MTYSYYDILRKDLETTIRNLDEYLERTAELAHLRSDHREDRKILQNQLMIMKILQALLQLAKVPPTDVA